MSLIIGRVGLDVPLGSPRSWDLDGDLVSLTIDVAPGDADDAAFLALQLAGLMDVRSDDVVQVVWDAWPAVDGWYTGVELAVEMVGPSLANGFWRVRGRMVRVSAGSRFESFLAHGLRPGSGVSAGSADPLVGIPPRSSTYERDGVGLGGLASRPIAPDAGGGSVLVDVWAGNDDQVPAYWTCPPGGACDGAARLRVGPSLTPPSILHQADGWWSALEWDGSGDIEDLSGNGNDGTPTNGSGVAEPVLCVYEGTQWAFFPGWEDEGASTDGVAPSGTLDVRWESSPLPIDVSVTDYWPVHLGSDDDELGFTVRQEIGTGELELRFSLDGSTAVTATATALPSGADAGQRRITRNPTTGAVTFYERASGVLTSDAGWTQVGAVVTAATGAINSDPTQSLAISGPTTGATWDSLGQGFGGRLDRLVVSDGTGVLADFDPTLAARPFATFTGGASETWTFHRATSTGSFRVGVVDRTCVMFGNTSYFDMGDVLDAGTGPVTVVHAFWHQMATPSLAGLVGKGNAVSNPTGQGYGLGMLDNTGGGPGTGGLLGVASDGTDFATSLAAGAPKPAMGTVSTVALVLDRDADQVTTYVDGVAASAGDATAVGDAGNSDPFRVGAVWNDGQQAWVGTAVFLGALTAAEIDQAGDELTAAAIPEPNTIDEQLAAYRTVVGRHVPGDVDPNSGWCLDNGLWRTYPKIGNPSKIVHEAWDDAAEVWRSFEWRWAPDDADFSHVYVQVKRNTLAEVTIETGVRLASGYNYPNLLTARRGDRNCLIVLPGGYIAVDDTPGTNITGGVESTSTVDGCTLVIATTEDGARETSPMGINFPGETTVGFAVELPSAATVDQAAALSQQFAAWVDETVFLRSTP